MQRIKAAGWAVVGIVLTVDVIFVVFDSEQTDSDRVANIIFTIVTTAIAAAIWWFVVVWAARNPEGNTPAKVGMICGILAAVTSLVWWTSVPFVLGAGAAMLGLEGKDRASKGAGRAGMATAGLVLGILAVAFWIFAVATD